MSAAVSAKFTEINQTVPYPEVTTESYQKSRNLAIFAVSTLGVVGISLIVMGSMDGAGLNAISGSAIGVSFCVAAIIGGAIGKKKLNEKYQKLKVNQQYMVMDAITMSYVSRAKCLHAVFNHAKRGEDNAKESEFRFCDTYGDRCVRVIRYNPSDFPDITNFSSDIKYLGTPNAIDKYELLVLNAWRESQTLQAGDNTGCFHSYKEDYSDVIAKTEKMYKEMRTYACIVEDLQKIEKYAAGKSQ